MLTRVLTTNIPRYKIAYSGESIKHNITRQSPQNKLIFRQYSEKLLLHTKNNHNFSHNKPEKMSRYIAKIPATISINYLYLKTNRNNSLLLRPIYATMGIRQFNSFPSNKNVSDENNLTNQEITSLVHDSSISSFHELIILFTNKITPLTAGIASSIITTTCILFTIHGCIFQGHLYNSALAKLCSRLSSTFGWDKQKIGIWFHFIGGFLIGVAIVMILWIGLVGIVAGIKSITAGL